MERPYRIAIVLGSWTMILGLVIAVVVPVVGGSVMLSNFENVNVDNGASFYAATSSFIMLSNWSRAIGLGMLFLGGCSIAVTLSRWYSRRDDLAGSAA
jgi:hypothetical protein